MSDDEKPPFLGSWKGRVIKAVVVDGARTFKEIQESTGLYYTTLKQVLAELHKSNSIEYNTETKKYWVKTPLYKRYEKHFQDEDQKKHSATTVKISMEAQEEFSRWIDNWKDNKEGVDFDLRHKHFFLEGTHLEEFSKDIITKATAEVLVINPWVDRNHLSGCLRIPAQKEEVKVSLIARSTSNNKKQEYLSILKKTGVRIFINDTVHAKLIVVDRAVAIVSSMNFNIFSTGGQSWEAGLVSIEPKVANEVADTILRMIEMHETTEM